MEVTKEKLISLWNFHCENTKIENDITEERGMLWTKVSFNVSLLVEDTNTSTLVQKPFSIKTILGGFVVQNEFEITREEFESLRNAHIFASDRIYNEKIVIIKQEGIKELEKILESL